MIPWIKRCIQAHRDRKQRRMELMEVIRAVELTKRQKEYEKIRAEIRKESELYGNPNDFAFDTEAEASAFRKGLNLGMDHSVYHKRSITRVDRVNEWRFRVWIKEFSKGR